MGLWNANQQRLASLYQLAGLAEWPVAHHARRQAGRFAPDLRQHLCLPEFHLVGGAGHWRIRLPKAHSTIAASFRREYEQQPVLLQLYGWFQCCLSDRELE